MKLKAVNRRSNLSDVTDNRQILDELSRRRLISLFQDHDFPIVVRALSEQKVTDLAIFLLVLTRTKTSIPTLSETEETSNDLLLVDRAAQILANLPADQQTGVAQEIVAIDMLPTEQIKETVDQIVNHVTAFAESTVVFGAGTENLAKLLSKMDASQQGQLVESLRVTNPELATGLNREIMPFSSLSMLDDETIRTLVNYLDVNTIAVAIHNLPQEIQDRFLNVMEGDMATEIEAKMDSLGFAETQIASTAQQSILDLVYRLAAKGILQIHQSNGIPDV